MGVVNSCCTDGTLATATITSPAMSLHPALAASGYFIDPSEQLIFSVNNDAMVAKGITVLSREYSEVSTQYFICDGSGEIGAGRSGVGWTRWVNGQHNSSMTNNNGKIILDDGASTIERWRTHRCLNNEVFKNMRV